MFTHKKSIHVLKISMGYQVLFEKISVVYEKKYIMGDIARVIRLLKDKRVMW